MARIFISYRRSDTGGHASLLYSYLEEHYPGEIFLDRNTLEDGDRWDREIAAHLASCEALLVVIGPGWLKARNEESGMRRLDDPADWVRREVETGLRRQDLLVIPVLMGGATLPKKEYLPAPIQELVLREARTIGDRDARDDVRRLVDQLAKKVGPSPPRLRSPKPAPAAADPARYLRALHRETAHIDIRGLQVGQQKAHRFRIDELYTPLTTVLAPEERRPRKKGAPPEELARPPAEPGKALGEHRSVPLQEALKQPRVVLVGDPGAGKSTFLQRIAFAACETLLGENPSAARQMLGPDPCPFPLRLMAASLAGFIDEAKKDPRRACPPDPDSPDWLIRYLEWRSSECDWGLPAGFFAAKLRGGCLLLVDGLDEAPDRPRRKNLARLLERAASVYRNSRIVATSRPSAYGGETSLAGYDSVLIAPLDNAAVETFVANWCRGLFPGDETGAAAHRKALGEAIRSKPEIEELAVNPVMLTALAVLQWNDKRLPDQRAELYESVLTWLARSRDVKRTGQKDREPAERCLALLQHLAFVMHSGSEGKRVEISPHAAARALADRFRDLPPDEQLAAAERFLQVEEIDSGILVGRNGKLRYWHRTFQEFLAARTLAGRDQERQRLLFREGKLYLEEWRETVLLLAGVLCKQEPERIDAFLSQVLDGLGEKPSLAARARCVGLIGRILQDLKSWNYTIADPRYRDNLDHVMAIFDAQTAHKIPFKIRLEAADALGQAGDPRLDEDNWVDLPGGSFWMGAQKQDPRGQNYDEEAYDAEAPVHRVTVSAFQMGRYPVTVQEYARFVEEKGYEKKQYWEAGGYGMFSEPDRWQQQLRFPNRPVVYVSWYEAAAYCKWIGGRLPKEAEWEYAARCRREGVRYPWGNEEPDEHRANYGYEEEPRHATPVGLYPAGATPSGLHDLAGNVYEWLGDWWGDYASEEATNPRGPDEGATKVLRGGAWVNYPGDLRVSYRSRGGPDVRGLNIGFRSVREVISL